MTPQLPHVLSRIETSRSASESVKSLWGKLTRSWRSLLPRIRSRRLGRPKPCEIEPCEVRLLPASSSLVSRELTIKGSNGWHDYTTVTVVNKQVWVYVTSIRSTGGTVSIHSKYYTASSVETIRFYGYSGNDHFSNGTAIRTSIVDGGSGNDTLYGGSNSDVLHGGADHDLLFGYDGNDDLYGDGGDDTLRGGDGLDGLYGGEGADRMYGEGGADRFLTSTDRSEAFDFDSAIDAVVWFLPGDISWKESEVESADVGLRVLHHRTANTNLLIGSSTRPFFFKRYHVRPQGASTTALADNTGLWIRVYDNAFASAAITASVTVHEIAHSWMPDELTTEGKAWNALSGWQRQADGPLDMVLSGDGKWWYRLSAKFGRFYGRNNPYEDWATSWESYFVFNHPRLSNAFNSVKLPPEKVAYLETFFKVQTLKS